jgi:hypothetical protein
MSFAVRRDPLRLVAHGAWRRLITSASSSAETYSPQLRIGLGKPVDRRGIAHDGQSSPGLA